MSRWEGLSSRGGFIVTDKCVWVELTHIVETGSEVPGIVLDTCHDKDFSSHGQQVHADGSVGVTARSQEDAKDSKYTNRKDDTQQIQQGAWDGFIVVIRIGKGQINQMFAKGCGLKWNGSFMSFHQIV